MSSLFLNILEMSVMGSVVILITMLIRQLLRKRSKRFILILWAVVVLRLMIPVSIESPLSIFNLLPPFRPEPAQTRSRYPISWPYSRWYGSPEQYLSFLIVP